MQVTTGDCRCACFAVGHGRPVILIHGLADDHRAWRFVLPELVLTHAVHLYDLRGHGRSTLGTPAGDLAQLGDDLVDLLGALGIGPAILVGFSLGGTIAMRVAIDRPELVAGLVLAATSSRVGAAAATWYATRAGLVAEADPGLRATLDADTAAVYANAPEQLAAGLSIRREATAEPAGYANACRAMAKLHGSPLDGELGRIVAPTAVMSAARDQHCPPRAGEIIAAGIAGATLQVVPSCGHPIPVERPDRVVEAVALVAGEAAQRGRYG